VQRLATRITYPSGFNRQYRCVIDYIKSYVMEELANLVFVGCLVAKLGPPGFQRLWKEVQPAVWHYIYGFQDNKTDQQQAANHMRNYACLLEQLVEEQQVCNFSGA
jgi:hypothetical protein